MDAETKRKIVNMEAARRRRWANPGAHNKMKCRGGPYDGQTLALQNTESLTIKVGAWHGRYVFIRERIRFKGFCNIGKWEDTK